MTDVNNSSQTSPTSRPAGVRSTWRRLAEAGFILGVGVLGAGSFAATTAAETPACAALVGKSMPPFKSP